MSNKYNFYFSDIGYLIPENIKGVSSVVVIAEERKPKIKKSITEKVHEVEDDWLFYTTTPGKYIVLQYVFDNIQIVKYKPQYGLKYNVCIKSSLDSLTYTINNKQYNIVSDFDVNALHMNFDTEDFFNYDFSFCAFEEKSNAVIYHTIAGILYAKIHSMIIELGKVSDDITAIGKLNDKLHICYEKDVLDILKAPVAKKLNDFKDDAGILCFDWDKKNNQYSYMIWMPSSKAYALGYNNEKELQCINKFSMTSIKGFTKKPNMPTYEIVKIYANGNVETANNELAPNTSDAFKRLTYNSANFGNISNLSAGGFDLMIKIHRNIIRNLYAKYLYVDVLDIGIGKCRDVYAYQRYISKSNIHGVEPNKDFSKFCTIRNIYTNTADGIFKFFKLKRMLNKFHTIIFCNSYNFVTDPYITLKECEEYLADGGRIIMIYMNNDNVITEKNEYYEIRKGEKNPDLPDNHVLSGRQNFIQVFSETTLVPPHYENQISESEIIDAMNKVNSDLKGSRPNLEIVEKGNLVHKLSEWLNPEAKLFNSMFNYIVLGKPCNVNKVIIAVDIYTNTLKDYLDYMRSKLVYCNGLEIIQYRSVKLDQQSNKMLCIVVRTLEEFNKLSDDLKKINKKYEVIINIQKFAELEYAIIYKENVQNFINERQKIFDLNIQHSKFGFNQQY
jgi:SAM-dependent methyltransferase